MKTCAILVPALLLVSCGQAPTPQEQAPTPAVSSATETNADTKVIAPPERAPATEANGADERGPALLTPEAERGVEGARNVLLSFARAIEREDYGQAWAMLGRADKQKWSEAGFAAMFAKFAKATVTIPVGTMEGAAGSSYYTAPVTITGSDKDGRPVRMAGEAVLRRVNDVDGATPTQLRWHFETLTLDAMP